MLWIIIHSLACSFVPCISFIFVFRRPRLPYHSIFPNIQKGKRESEREENGVNLFRRFLGWLFVFRFPFLFKGVSQPKPKSFWIKLFDMREKWNEEISLICESHQAFSYSSSHFDGENSMRTQLINKINSRRKYRYSTHTDVYRKCAISFSPIPFYHLMNRNISSQFFFFSALRFPLFSVAPPFLLHCLLPITFTLDVFGLMRKSIISHFQLKFITSDSGMHCDMR